MYNFKSIERESQQKWSFITNIDNNKPKYYILEMFPYPSGNIHMGHLRNYTIGDVVARYKRAFGFNVLHPIGWDAFGLPAENAALQHKIHPRKWTEQNIVNMKKQLQDIGLSYDWSREITTCDPEYYKHEQKFFLEWLEYGLAYRKESLVNWDPVDNTVLANEQVIDGRGWRSGAQVEKKKLSQWFLKITEFAPDLLESLEQLTDWPEKVRMMQNNWIGKSEGVVIEFKLVDEDHSLKVFSTRPETIFGASFCAISIDHPLVQTLTDVKLAEFIKKHHSITEQDIERADKEGFDTKIKVYHPFIKGRILPVYVANFVLADYGTGAIFACPAHDKRDYDFAKKYNLPVYPVIKATGDEGEFYDGGGILCNSQFLDGLDIKIAKQIATERLVQGGYAEKIITYRLRDWGISRQRYWGCPIPIIYCDECGVVSVPKEDLPVTLPYDIDYNSSGNPLKTHPTWKHVQCPKCKKDAIRETDTFDTFFESSWYFIAFCGSDTKSYDYFLPVDCYIGGVEHAVLHLLYARFFTKALKKYNHINISEPFSKLITQGMICHHTYYDKHNNFLTPDQAKKSEQLGEKITMGRVEKMSKSKKNVINPSSIIDKYGADTARLFMLSDIPPERDLEWSENGLEGAWRYVNRVYRLIENYERDNSSYVVADLKLHKILHKCLQALTDDLEQCRLNCAVAKLHEMTNLLYSDKGILLEGLPILIKCMEPFIPHLAEHAWSKIRKGGFLVNEPWPRADTKLLIDDTVTIAVQINGKLKKTIETQINSTKEKLEKQALEATQHIIGDNKVNKVIVVPNKIVNIVL